MRVYEVVDLPKSSHYAKATCPNGQTSTQNIVLSSVPELASSIVQQIFRPPPPPGSDLALMASSHVREGDYHGGNKNPHQDTLNSFLVSQLNCHPSSTYQTAACRTSLSSSSRLSVPA